TPGPMAPTSPPLPRLGRDDHRVPNIGCIALFAWLVIPQAVRHRRMTWRGSSHDRGGDPRTPAEGDCIDLRARPLGHRASRMNFTSGSMISCEHTTRVPTLGDRA